MPVPHVLPPSTPNSSSAKPSQRRSLSPSGGLSVITRLTNVDPGGLRTQLKDCPMPIRALNAFFSDIRIAVRASQTFSDLSRDLRASSDVNRGTFGLLPR